MADFNLETANNAASINDIPQDYRSFYEEGEGGKPVLKSDEATKTAVTHINNLRGALAAERTGHKKTKEGVVDLSPLSEYGSSPEEISSAVKTTIEELQNKINEGSNSKLDLDKIKKDIGKAHAVELGKKDEVISKLTGQMDAMLIDNELASSFAKAKANPDDVDLLMLAARPFLKTIETEDGKRKAVVLDANGSIRYDGATQQEMTPERFVREMAESPKYAKLFLSDQPDGNGGPNNNNRRVNTDTKKTERTSREKIRDGLKNRQRGRR